MVLEIIYVLILLIGIYVVLKSRGLTKSCRILWVISILLFNLLALLCFFIWKQTAVNRNAN